MNTHFDRMSDRATRKRRRSTDNHRPPPPAKRAKRATVPIPVSLVVDTNAEDFFHTNLVEDVRKTIVDMLTPDEQWYLSRVSWDYYRRYRKGAKRVMIQVISGDTSANIVWSCTLKGIFQRMDPHYYSGLPGIFRRVDKLMGMVKVAQLWPVKRKASWYRGHQFQSVNEKTTFIRMIKADADHVEIV